MHGCAGQLSDERTLPSIPRRGISCGGRAGGSGEHHVLPGVGRKTANVVLGNAFDIPGITVDTHVGRLSRRMGFTDHEDPVKAEQDLMAIFPRKTWTQMSHVMIWHGRRCCHSRRPACGACPVVQWCPGAGIGPMDPEEAAKLLKGPQ